MKKILALITIALTTQAAVPPVRTMYQEALAREQAVRGALAAPEALATILADVHAVVAAYEAIVRHYPASGYSDNALWNAGCLSLDAFAKFGQERDKDTAIRLLNKLVATYPTSKLVKQVPAQLARVGDAAAPPQLVPRQAPDERAAAPSSKIATIRDIRRSVLPGSVRITIELDAETTYHDEHIMDPERVFVDLAGTRAAPALVDQTLRFDGDADLVRQVRIGRHPNTTTRVVLDAAGISSYSVYPLYGPFRLVIDCVRAAATTARTVPAGPKAPASLASRPLKLDPLRAIPALAPRAAALIADATAVEPPSPPMKLAGPVPTAMTTAPATPITPPARNATGGFSMARQLGLGVSRVVIDPGHGGHDPGAKGKGVAEAELVLDVALRLEKLLQKAGMEVILTRRTDEFIPLQERPAIANREGADLFLSIHANASPSATTRGIETYFLNFANSPNAAQVAARENAASALSMGALPDFVKAIALNNKLDESRDFATQVQHAMIDRLRANNKGLKDLGVKQAPFIVLIGATMPSVLAEISFVTNTQEARLLKGNAYRQRIADALFNAIRKYQTSLKSVQTVAHQN
jgi:N-acetylmuramoyl-L-alanine amidase